MNTETRGRKYQPVPKEDEEKIIMLICEGKTVKFIASEMGTDLNGINHIIRKIRRKYSAETILRLAVIFTKLEKI